MLLEAPSSIVASYARARLEKYDHLTVEVTEDFESYSALAASAGKTKTTPEMARRGGQFFKDPSQFILVRDGSGDLAATIAFRTWEAGACFTDFLNRLYRSAYDASDAAIDVRMVPPSFDQIKGRVCYVGEFFIAPKWRRQIEIGDLAILAYAEARRRGDPDWFFGFVRAKHAKLGLPIRYHGARIAPAAVTWLEENAFHRSEDSFVCSDRADIDWAFRCFVETSVKSDSL